MKTLVYTMVTVLAAATMAPAETMLPEIADTDGSGAWSLTELQALWPDMTGEDFAVLDTNADGSVDQAELVAAVDAGTVQLPAQ